MGRRGAGGQSSLGSRTATRALIAAGTYVAQDLRDPDGVTRPLLRRTALRMVASRQATLRRLGSAYLRGDAPTPEELSASAAAAGPLLLPPGQPEQAPAETASQARPDGTATAV
jgi:hypothetical protein